MAFRDLSIDEFRLWALDIRTRLPCRLRGDDAWVPLGTGTLGMSIVPVDERGRARALPGYHRARLSPALPINKEIDEQTPEDRDMCRQLHQLTKSIGYNRETEIDERIATIESKIWNDPLTLKEEATYLAEIQELKRRKAKLGPAHAMAANLSSFSAPSAQDLHNSAS